MRVIIIGYTYEDAALNRRRLVQNKIVAEEDVFDLVSTSGCALTMRGKLTTKADRVYLTDLAHRGENYNDARARGISLLRSTGDAFNIDYHGVAHSVL